MFHRELLAVYNLTPNNAEYRTKVAEHGILHNNNTTNMTYLLYTTMMAILLLVAYHYLGDDSNTIVETFIALGTKLNMSNWHLTNKAYVLVLCIYMVLFVVVAMAEYMEQHLGPRGLELKEKLKVTLQMVHAALLPLTLWVVAVNPSNSNWQFIAMAPNFTTWYIASVLWYWEYIKTQTAAYPWSSVARHLGHPGTMLLVDRLIYGVVSYIGVFLTVIPLYMLLYFFKLTSVEVETNGSVMNSYLESTITWAVPMVVLTVALTVAWVFWPNRVLMSRTTGPTDSNTLFRPIRYLIPWTIASLYTLAQLDYQGAFNMLTVLASVNVILYVLGLYVINFGLLPTSSLPIAFRNWLTSFLLVVHTWYALMISLLSTAFPYYTRYINVTTMEDTQNEYYALMLDKTFTHLGLFIGYCVLLMAFSGSYPWTWILHMQMLFTSGAGTPSVRTSKSPMLTMIPVTQLESLLNGASHIHVLLNVAHAPFPNNTWVICTLSIDKGYVQCDYSFDTVPSAFQGFINQPVHIPSASRIVFDTQISNPLMTPVELNAGQQEQLDSLVVSLYHVVGYPSKDNNITTPRP